MTRSRKRGRPPHDDVLTPAEGRIADAIRHGMSNVSIARRRAISRDAVKFHLANILGKLGLADRQSLKHWPGKPKCGVVAPRETLMQTSAGQTFGAIGQIARSVADIGAAERWYRDVLGLTHLYTFGPLAFFDCGGVRLMLSADDEGGPPQATVLYFRVDDIATSYEEMQARGIAFLGAPHMIHRHVDGTEEWMAFFNDNEGRPLAIMSQVRPG
jgi:DNA-binding CsgD family transcriptional regulator/catechol 2,3-dioxygenase-like lactoylglutathione lyase family enzyme